MDKKTLDILETIVNLDGDCLTDELCGGCPFKKQCLPEFVLGKPLSKKQRLHKALDQITREVIFNDKRHQVTTEN